MGIARGTVLEHTESHHVARRAVLVALALGIALMGLATGAGVAQAAGSCTLAGAKVWSAGAVDNNWFNANNWIPAGAPAAGSNVCIQNSPPGGKVVIGTGVNTSIGSIESSQPLQLTAGTLTLTSTTQISDMHSTLTLTGGTLAGAGNLSVDGSLVWEGGATMTGAGATIITSAGTLAINDGSDAGTRQLKGNRNLTVNGAATWSGSNFVCMDTGAKLIVASGGTMNVTNNQQIYNCGGGGVAPLVSILSGGSLTKSSAATTNMSVPFQNAGTVSTSSGTLSLDGGSGAGSSSGTWTAAAGSTIDMNATHNASAMTVDGAGKTRVIGGTLNLTGAGSVAAGGTLELLSSGTVQGAGNLTVTGTLLWSGDSTMTGNGDTTIAPAGTLTINDATNAGERRLTSNRTLAINGTAIWSGTANICIADGANIDVAGSLTTSNAQYAYNCTGLGTPKLNVLAGGTLTKGTTGTTNVYVPFDNDGSVHAGAGVLSLDGGSGTGSSSGTWTAAAGTSIDLAGGTHNAAPLPLTGAGKLRVNGGTLNLTGAGTVDPASTLELTSSGTVQGTANLTVDGTLLWSGDSTMTGSGDTIIAPAGTLTMNSAVNAGERRLTSNRTLAINGTGTWSGTGNICIADGANIDVAGSLTANNAQYAYNCTGLGTPKLNVLAGGTLTKGATGTTNVYVPFENDGNVNGSAGVLSLDGGSATGSHSGTWTPGAGLIVDLTNGTANAAPLAVAGAGKLRVSGGTLNLTGAGTVDPTGTLEMAGGTVQGAGNLTVDGTLLWSGDSTMTGTGDTTIAPAGALTINAATNSGDRRLTSSRTLAINGTATWSGVDNICVADGANIDVAGSLTANNAQVVYNCTGLGTPKLNVLAGGTLTKGATGTTNVSVPFDNDGSVDGSAGVLSLDAGSGTGSHSGTWTPGTGLIVDLMSGMHNFGSLAADGAGKLRVNNGGTLNLTGAGTVAAAGTVELASGGTVQGAGNLTVDGTLLWSGDSTMTGTGDTTIAPAGTLTINAATSTGDRRLTANRTLALNGTSIWSGADNLCITGGANVDVAGSLTANNAQLVYDCLGSGTAQLNVLAGGEFAKATTGGGVTTVDVPYSNAGTTRVGSGKLYVQNTFSNYNSATKTLTGGAYVVTNSAGFQFTNADVVTNAAEITLSGATARFLDQTGTTNGLRSLAVNAAAGRLELLSNKNLSVPGAFTNNGTLALGATSTFTSTGNYIQSASGRLKPRVEGTTPGTNAGHVVAGGGAALNGELRVDAPNLPPADTQVEIVTSTGPRTGTFSSVKGGPGYSVQYLANAVRLVSTTAPGLAVGDASVVEGDAGTTTMSFKVSMSSPRLTPVTFKWQTLNGGAIAPGDYALVPLTTVTFAPGEVEKTLSVTVNGDTVHENDEFLQVRISAATGATIVDNLAAGRILDEEGPLFAYVGDPNLNEGNAGTSPASFAVTLSAVPAPGQTVSVNYATANGSATTADNDYVAKSGTLTFTSATGATQTVDVDVNGDATNEANQTFKLNLSSPSGGVLLGDTSGTATIRNDDGAGPAVKPSMYVSNAAVVEADAGATTASFDVTLSAASAGTVTAKYATANSSAVTPADYTQVPATTLTFAPGEVTKTVTVDVTGDTVRELTEQFQVKLSALSGAVAGDVLGVGYILDDEGPLSFSISDVHIAEGDSGTRNAVMTVSIPETTAAGQQIGVTFAVTPGTATTPDDYTVPAGTTVSFNSGTGATRPITVPIVGDGAVEGDETFNVTLSAPKGAVLADNTGVFTIHNDD